MVASSSNLLIPQQPVSSTVATRTTATMTTDNFTDENINHGFLIASNSSNNISGGHLKDIIRLETTSTVARPSNTANDKYLSPRRKSTGGAVVAALTTCTAKARRARRPRRQKMASVGVDAMRMMMTNDSIDIDDSNINSTSISTATSFSRKGARRSTTCIGIPITQATCTPLPSTTSTMIASALSLCRGEVEQVAAASPKSQPPQQQDDTPISHIDLNLAVSSLLLSVSNNNNNHDHVDEDEEWGTFVSLDDEEDVYFHRYGR